MNWYKKAFPIVEDRSNSSYLSIGHKYKKQSKDYLWDIDKNWNFEKKFIESDFDYHGEWKGRSSENWIACGRYEGATNKASLVLGYNIKQESPSRIEYVTKEISKILDREFNNPKIIIFDN